MCPVFSSHTQAVLSVMRLDSLAVSSLLIHLHPCLIEYITSARHLGLFSLTWSVASQPTADQIPLAMILHRPSVTLILHESDEA